MRKYTFLRQKALETMPKFEKRVNDMANQGWVVHSFASDGFATVLLEREK